MSRFASALPHDILRPTWGFDLHQVEDLIHLFDSCFRDAYRTCLVRGDDEPLYLPAKDSESLHQIIFAHSFFSSALHEISHWLIAGEKRRLLVDYGYWYEADGRSLSLQHQFEAVEVKPQALEWILSDACQFRFQFSADNLNGEAGDSLAFRHNIARQAQQYCVNGLPMRAQIFRAALAAFYQGPKRLCPSRFLEL